MSFDDRINKAVVTASQLARANDLSGSAAEAAVREGRPVDFLTLMAPIMNEFLGTLSPVQVTAISFRLQALSTLIIGREAENWTLRVGDGDAVFIQESVYEAAARAKIDVSGTDPTFDRNEFLAIALRFSESEGRA